MARKVLLGEGFGEIIEKKSRFIAGCYEISSEEDALRHIEELRKQYWDARHNCFAYVVGPNNEIQRFSDDKEPQGTAGKPILEVLLSNELTNTLIVVTRYFGGVLLGTGGLVRAYSAAAAEGLKNSVLSEVFLGKKLRFTCDYSLTGKIQYLILQLAEFGTVLLTDTVYSDKVTFEILAEEKMLDTLTTKLTETSSGQADLSFSDALSFAINKGRPVYLSI